MSSLEIAQDLDQQIVEQEQKIAKLEKLQELRKREAQLQSELAPPPVETKRQPAAGARHSEKPSGKNENGQEPGASQRFTREADGIYRDRKSKKYYHRPTLDGRRTWRSLKTRNLKVAKERFHEFKSSGGSSPAPRKAGSAVTCGIVLNLYKKDGCPDKYLKTREADSAEFNRADMLLKFWDKVPISDVDVPRCIKYFDWRVKQLIKATDGRRTTDLDFNAFRSALRHGQRKGLFKAMPLAGEKWPRFKNSANVRHCREFMPRNAEELHRVAEPLFARWKSAVLGFQALFEANTGFRTSEALQLRMDARADEPGAISEDGLWLCVRRVKGQDGVSPYAKITPEFRQLLEAHKKWHKENYPTSPWYFPSPVDPMKPVGKTALVSALDGLRKPKHKGRGKNGAIIPPQIQKKITSHGLRAWYVTVRRSHGASDAKIAWEIGHTSGGSTIINVYGGIPEDWTKGGGPKMSWLPDGPPAWQKLWEKAENLEDGRLAA